MTSIPEIDCISGLANNFSGVFSETHGLPTLLSFNKNSLLGQTAISALLASVEDKDGSCGDRENWGALRWTQAY